MDKPKFAEGDIRVIVHHSHFEIKDGIPKTLEYRQRYDGVEWVDIDPSPALPKARRADAVEFLRKQFEEDENWGENSSHHYGRQELRLLFDFIYGGPPRHPREVINGGAFE